MSDEKSLMDTKSTSCDYLFIQPHEHLLIYNDQTGEKRLITPIEDTSEPTSMGLLRAPQQFLLVKLPRIPFNFTLGDLPVEIPAGGVSSSARKKTISQAQKDKLAKNAERSRRRYHGMTAEQKREYNKRRSEQAKAKRAKLKEILDKPYEEATEEDLEFAKRVVTGKRIRTNKSQIKAAKLTPMTKIDDETFDDESGFMVDETLEEEPAPATKIDFYKI